MRSFSRFGLAVLFGLSSTAVWAQTATPRRHAADDSRRRRGPHHRRVHGHDLDHAVDEPGQRSQHELLEFSVQTASGVPEPDGEPERVTALRAELAPHAAGDEQGRQCRPQGVPRGGLSGQHEAEPEHHEQLERRCACACYWAQYTQGKFEFLAGQSWSLMTPNRNGLSPMPGDLFFSQDVDTNYQMGLTWARTPGVRFVGHGSSILTAGLAVENPEQYTGSAVVLPATFRRRGQYRLRCDRVVEPDAERVPRHHRQDRVRSRRPARPSSTSRRRSSSRVTRRSTRRTARRRSPRPAAADRSMRRRTGAEFPRGRDELLLERRRPLHRQHQHAGLHRQPGFLDDERGVALRDLRRSSTPTKKTHGLRLLQLGAGRRDAVASTPTARR